MAPKSKSRPGPAMWAKPRFLLLVIGLFYAVMMPTLWYWVWWTPTPLPLDAPADQFSEARAKAHVKVLATDIFDRQVSTPGLERAAQYVLAQARSLADLANAREDMTGEASLEVVSGSRAMDFHGAAFTTAYRGLPNVVLALRPREQEAAARRAVLLLSHFDSAICSQGASDDASQVGNMLEAARVLVARRQGLETPVIFLFTGGEETISQAAHGFTSSSAHRHHLGAFINLEALGAGGLPIAFQHTGAWALEAYARGAKLPRGSRVAQDIFDMQLFPADSDYRMVSARHYGWLPGIDVAYLADSAAYHSYRDSTERIREGVMQELGESLLGVISAMSSALASDPHAALNSPREVASRACYLDFIGLGMVTWRDDVAGALHATPLALLLLLPLLEAGRGEGLSQSLRHTCLATLRSLATTLLALLLPIGFGVAWALLGRPMSWFAQPWMAVAVHAPLALVGGLLPWLGVAQEAARHCPDKPGRYMSYQVRGTALLTGVAAVALSALGLMGLGMMFFMAALVATVMGCGLLGESRLFLPGLLLSLLVAFLPVSASGGGVSVFVSVLADRSALMGHITPWLADVVVAALVGLATLSFTAGCMLPLIAYGLQGIGRRALALLCLSSLLLAALTTATMHPYSHHRPKRVVVTHIHKVDVQPWQDNDNASGSGSGAAGSAPWRHPMSVRIQSSKWAVTGLDSHPLHSLLRLPGLDLEAPAPLDDNKRDDSTGASSGTASAKQGFRAGSRLPLDGREFSTIFPLQHMLLRDDAVAFRAPAPLVEHDAMPPVRHAPYIYSTGEEVDAGRGVRRVRLSLWSEKAFQAMLNVTGPLAAWSFADQLTPSPITAEGRGTQHFVRMSSQDPQPSAWDFWLEAPLCSPQQANDSSSSGSSSSSSCSGIEPLGVEVYVKYLDRTEALEQLVERFEPWMTEIYLATVYQSYYKF